MTFSEAAAFPVQYLTAYHGLFQLARTSGEDVVLIHAAAGGVGSIVGSLIGALVYVSLTNGMNLMGTGSDAQNIVKGIVLAAAVIFDVATRRQAK